MKRTIQSIVFTTIALSAATLLAAPPKDAGRMPLDCIHGAKFSFDGVLGERVHNNIEQWLLVTPERNPGLLDMFTTREQNIDKCESLDDPTKLVPWAGEFVGKYLISSAQALRMSDDPRLRETVSKVVDRLLQLQAEDGYLGPWPKGEQLMAHWDLWGNYHVLFGLMLWAEETGDQRAEVAAERIADLVCDTFLNTKVRVVNAGSCEMNMGMIHGLTMLYRKTGKQRYLDMAKEILKDFEKGGDYYRMGLSGEEYYRTPKPRWESLHSLQGLAELYWITGDETFRQSFLHHWASMRRFDLRNTGGFSSWEQATGNPYADSALETCCVIAWETVMLDALRLTGDSLVADDIETATFNAIAGAQHPSGAWCTYTTPINGRKNPSHVDIHFQARNGAEFLNCCSVNGPRGFGMLSEWAVMQSDDGLALNYFGPMRAEVALKDGTPVVLEETTGYPLEGNVKIKVSPKTEKQFTLSVRIPTWSEQTTVEVNGKAVANVIPGKYLKLQRTWKPGDIVSLKLDMRVRYESGDLEQVDHVALYRGPILLCADERFVNPDGVKIDLGKLNQAKRIPLDDSIVAAAEKITPWLMVETTAGDGKSVRLVDFASAGASGKTYRSWISADGARPPRPVAWLPADNARLVPGDIVFVWRRPAESAKETRRHTIVISDTPTFEKTVLRYGNQPGTMLVLPADEVKKLEQGKTYFWKVIADNGHGTSESLGPHKRFTVAADGTPQFILLPRADGLLTESALAGDPKPSYGHLASATDWQPCAGPDGKTNGAIEFDGKHGMAAYQLMSFPNQNYTAVFWLCVKELPAKDMYGQAFSAWTGPGDDPLRVVVQNGKLSARIEGGGMFSTEEIPVEPNRWYHVAVVKQNEKLTLYIDGQASPVVNVPVTLGTTSKMFAIGGNPCYTGPEFLAAKFARLHLFERPLSAEEVQALFHSVSKP